jgi:hypothetical protein
MHCHAHRWLEKPWFAALLLTVLGLRAVLPAGFMFGASGDGGFGLRLCSQDATAARPPGDTRSSPAPGDGAVPHDAGPCPFAAALGAAAPPAEAWTLPLITPAGTESPDGVAVASTPGRPHPHLARGPPPIA